MNNTAIEALWFEPGTAADAAMAANRYRARVRWVSPAGVKRLWEKAQAEGRLPPTIVRPTNGFPKGPREIVLRFWDLFQGKAAA